jgi:hypothetical protein
MRLLNSQEKMLELLRRQELLLAELYRMISEQQSRDRDFWLKLSTEELGHAQWVEYLEQKAKDGAVTFAEQRTRMTALQSYVDYILSVTAKVKVSPPTRLRALSLALDIERSLMEKSIFQHFTGDSRAVVELLTSLRTKTDEHRMHIEKKVASVRTER